MAIALVKSAKGTSAVATTTASFASATTAGNLIVLRFAANDYNGTPDTGWTQSSGMEQQGFHGSYLWWRISTGETSFQYTIGSVEGSAWILEEWSGLDASPYDVSNGQIINSGGQAAYTTPTITPTTGSRLLLASMGGLNNTDLTAQTWGTWLNSFTYVDTSGNNQASGRDIIGSAYRIVTGNGSTTYSSGATCTTTLQSRSGLIISFKESASGGTTVNLTGAAASALAGTVSSSIGDSVSITGASVSALAGTAAAQTGDSASLTGAAAAAMAGTASPSILVTPTGAACAAMSGGTTPALEVLSIGAAVSAMASGPAPTAAVAPVGAQAQALAGILAAGPGAEASGASAAALAGIVAATVATAAIGAVAQALAGTVSTTGSAGAAVNIAGASAAALAGTVAISSAAPAVGASAAALAGTLKASEAGSPVGAACVALAGDLGGAVSALMTGAMAAALAGALAVGLLVAPDGASAAALTGPVGIESSSSPSITGAAAAAIAGDVTTRIVVTQLNPNYIARGAARTRVALGYPRSMIAAGARRDRIVVGISNAMSQTSNLVPPIDDTVEVETVTFDFGLLMAAGVVLTGTPAVTCVVYGGTDSDPSSRLVGEPSIVASPNSGAAEAAISQLVGTMLTGVTYRLQCVCATSDGQTLSLWTHLSCRAPD